MGLIEDNEINNNTLAGVWITTGKILPDDPGQNTVDAHAYEDFLKTKTGVNNRHFLNGNSNKVVTSGADTGFFKGLGGGGGDWYLGVAESMGHASQMLQFENWNLIENCYTRSSNNVTKYKLQ